MAQMAQMPTQPAASAPWALDASTAGPSAGALGQTPLAKEDKHAERLRRRELRLKLVRVSPGEGRHHSLAQLQHSLMQ